MPFNCEAGRVCRWSKAADENVSTSAASRSRFVRRGSVSVRLRQLTAHVGSRLVLAQSFIDHLAQQIVAGPGKIFHLDDQLGPDPMHAAEFERRAEAALRGGGAASGILSVISGCSFRQRGCNSA